MTGDKKKPFKDKADSECRFRLLVMNAPFGFLELNTDGKITFANDSFHEMHGYSPGELIGADVKNFA
ncbi:MAG: PAS domain S-box protein, partial [Fibrobacterota bacterium]